MGGQFNVKTNLDFELEDFPWQSERVLSFIPPDGNFRLISYHIGSQK